MASNAAGGKKILVAQNVNDNQTHLYKSSFKMLVIQSKKMSFNSGKWKHLFFAVLGKVMCCKRPVHLGTTNDASCSQSPVIKIIIKPLNQ